MDTPTIVALAVAINIAVAVIAISLPWFNARRARSVPPRPAPLTASGRRSHATIGEPAGDVTAHAAAMRPVDGPGIGSDSAGTPWLPRVAQAAAAARDARIEWPMGLFHEPALDPQTGLDLGASWTRWLAEEEARMRRFRRPATVVLVELAGLDRLVERVGRDAAERLVPPIATTMRRFGRETDHVARLGPARFAALLAETDEIQAINYVERIRSACDVWLAAGAVALRLSMGWAEVDADRSAATALAEAEGRLFADRQRVAAEDAEVLKQRAQPPVSLAAASG